MIKTFTGVSEWQRAALEADLKITLIIKKFHCGFPVKYKDSLRSCESDKQGSAKTNEKYL